MTSNVAPIAPRRRPLFVFVLALALSCSGESTGPGVRPTPARLDVVSGDVQSDTVGTALPAPLVVRVLDASGQPIEGQLINFRVTAGGGSVFAGASITNADGLAQERWTLGTTALAPQHVEARAVDNSTGAPIVFATFTATAVAGAPDSIVVMRGAGQSAGAGAPYPDSLLVRVADRYGNPVPGVNVTWQAPAAAGNVSAASTSTGPAGTTGIRFTAGVTPGSYSVTASVGTGAASRQALIGLRVVAGKAASIVFVAGDGQSALINTAVAVDPVARVRDAYGNPAPNVTVAFRGGTNDVVSPATAITNDSGLVSTHWTLRSTTGSHSLLAVLDTTASAQITAIATAPPPTRLLLLAGDLQSAPPGTAVDTAPAVKVIDQGGVAVPGVTVRFAVASGGGSVLGPDAVTDAGGIARVTRWTLGAKGINTLSASLPAVPSVAPVVFTANALDASSDISVRIDRPTEASIVGDAMEVRVAPTSRYAVASVNVAIGGRSASLYFDTPSQRWVGTLNLQGLPRDTLVLLVFVRDVNGSETDALTKVIHDAPPVLSIASPADQSVARPVVTIDVSCTDDDPAGCTSLTVRRLITADQSAVVASGTSHIATSLDLSAYGSSVDLRFIATDSRGQQTIADRRIFVEPSSAMTLLDEGVGTAIDARPDRALFLDPSGQGQAWLKRFTSGVTDTITTASQGGVSMGFVSPTGAIVRRTQPVGSPTYVSEWRSGTLTDLSPLNSELSVAGDWGAYSNGSQLFRRDLVSGTSVQLSQIALNYGNSVATNGDVAFGTTNYDVVWYHGGTALALTHRTNTDSRNFFPVTDGVRVVFQRGAPNGSTSATQQIMSDGTTETALTTPANITFTPGVDYQVNGGWVAFAQLDAGGVKQLWTRSPDGVIRQVSMFGVNSSIDALAPDGTLVFRSGGRRYAATATGGVHDLMSDNGKVVWREGMFLVLLGNSVFRLTT